MLKNKVADSPTHLHLSLQHFWPSSSTGVELDIRLQRKDVHKTAKLFQPSPFEALFQAMLSPHYLKMYTGQYLNWNSTLNKAEQSIRELTMVMYTNIDQKLQNKLHGPIYYVFYVLVELVFLCSPNRVKHIVATLSVCPSGTLSGK